MAINPEYEDLELFIEESSTPELFPLEGSLLDIPPMEINFTPIKKVTTELSSIVDL